MSQRDKPWMGHYGQTPAEGTTGRRDVSADRETRGVNSRARGSYFGTYTPEEIAANAKAKQVKDDTEAMQRAEMDSRGTEKHDAIDQLLGNFHVTRRAGKERNKNGAASSAGTSANGSPGPAAAASPQNRDLKAQAAAVFQQRFVEPDGGAGFKDIPDDMSVGPDSEESAEPRDDVEQPFVHLFWDQLQGLYVKVTKLLEHMGGPDRFKKKNRSAYALMQSLYNLVSSVLLEMNGSMSTFGEVEPRLYANALRRLYLLPGACEAVLDRDCPEALKDELYDCAAEAETLCATMSSHMMMVKEDASWALLKEIDWTSIVKQTMNSTVNEMVEALPVLDTPTSAPRVHSSVAVLTHETDLYRLQRCIVRLLCTNMEVTRDGQVRLRIGDDRAYSTDDQLTFAVVKKSDATLLRKALAERVKRQAFHGWKIRHNSGGRLNRMLMHRSWLATTLRIFTAWRDIMRVSRHASKFISKMAAVAFGEGDGFVDAIRDGALALFDIMGTNGRSVSGLIERNRTIRVFVKALWGPWAELAARLGRNRRVVYKFGLKWMGNCARTSFEGWQAVHVISRRRRIAFERIRDMLARAAKGKAFRGWEARVRVEVYEREADEVQRADALRLHRSVEVKVSRMLKRLMGSDSSRCFGAWRDLLVTAKRMRQTMKGIQARADREAAKRILFGWHALCRTLREQRHRVKTMTMRLLGRVSEEAFAEWHYYTAHTAGAARKMKKHAALLAGKHHTTVFAAWKLFTGRAALSSKTNAARLTKHLAVLSGNVQQETFSTWSDTASTQRRIRSMTARNIGFSREMATSEAFSGWSDVALFAVRQKVSMERMTARWSSGSATAVFVAWKGHTAGAKERAVSLRRFLNKWTVPYLSSTFSALAKQAKHSSKVSKLLARHRDKMVGPALRSVFDGWVEAHTAQARLVAVLGRCFKRMSCGLAASAFNEMAAHAAEAGRRERLLGRFSAKWSKPAMANALVGWIEQSREAKRHRHLLSRMGAKLMNRRSAAAFDAWLDAKNELQKRRKIALRREEMDRADALMSPTPDDTSSVVVDGSPAAAAEASAAEELLRDLRAANEAVHDGLLQSPSSGGGSPQAQSHVGTPARSEAGDDLNGDDSRQRDHVSDGTNGATTPTTTTTTTTGDPYAAPKLSSSFETNRHSRESISAVERMLDGRSAAGQGGKAVVFPPGTHNRMRSVRGQHPPQAPPASSRGATQTQPFRLSPERTRFGGGGVPARSTSPAAPPGSARLGGSGSSRVQPARGFGSGGYASTGGTKPVGGRIATKAGGAKESFK